LITSIIVGLAKKKEGKSEDTPTNMSCDGADEARVGVGVGMVLFMYTGKWMKGTR
jgi:hypothetical protein